MLALQAAAISHIGSQTDLYLHESWWILPPIFVL